ncbi:MAG TPA: AAA family ATPase, partial [Acidimicrobiales bacterium]|nr:AAA family ATPase [Acidimicrobiales bacterium]
MLRAHTSRLAGAWGADPTAAPSRELEGTAVLADLSGFTRLTEVLTGTGAEGSEVLHEVMNRCFATLLGHTVDLDGDILGFAGDAALVWFDGEDHVRRAVEAAVAMPARLAALPAAVTGGRRLRVSVGVHTGAFPAVLAGTTQRAVFLCGPSTSLLATLQARAGSGQVLVSEPVAAELPPSWRGPASGPGVVVRRRGQPASRPRPTAVATPGEVPADLVAPSVRELLAAGVTTGDHRTASVGFVLVPGLDGLLDAGGLAEVHAAVDDVVATVTRVTTELSVDWLDTDVAVDGVKLLLAAGAPRSVDHDEDRLLLALRRIIDESGRPVRAGAQRGPLFAGLLGLPGRRTYTLLGDPVNVAARALSLAGDGELVAGDGLGVDDRAGVEAASLGPQHLRNRTRPVTMWRVDAVRPRPTATEAALPHAALVRPAELRRLAEAWKRTCDGAGGVVEVRAEAGMGASGLLAELATLAGATATTIAADPFRRHVPYAAVTDVVSQLAATHDADPWTWLAAATPQLAAHRRTWAADAIATATGTGAAHVDPRTTARRTQLVLADLLAAAAPTPWLLTVDDIHLVDDASRQVLAELRSTTASRPTLLVTSSPPLARPFADPWPATVVVDLEPIADDAATALVAELAPTLRDDEVRRIVDAARGNPLVLTELARRPPTGELPDSLRRLGATLVDALPARTRSLVRDASVLGPVFRAVDAATALERDELTDPAAWDGTEPVLRWLDDATLAFRHEAYRSAAYGSLPFRRRRQLHSTVADQLAEATGADDGLLAVHLELAGRPHDAYPRAVAAGRAAKAAGALVEAAEMLRRAADLAGVVAPAERGPLLVAQGEALAWLGDLDGAGRCYRTASRHLVDPVAQGWLCHLKAELALTRNRLRPARDWTTRGVRLTDVVGPSAAALRSRLLLDHAWRVDVAGRHRESVALAEEALALARGAGDRLLEGIAHMYLELSHSALFDPRAVVHGDAAIAIFEELGHDRYLNHVLGNTGLTAMHLGRWDLAIDRYQRGIEHGRASGHSVGAAATEMNLGFV